MWIEIIASIAITTFIKDPCKNKKCLVRASCTEVCGERTYYLKYCDREGHIMFQRICAISVIFGVIVLIFALITWYYKM